MGPDEGRLKGLPGAQLACNPRLLTSTSDLLHRDHIAIFISQTGCTRHANTVDGTPDRIRIQMCMSCGCRRLRMPEEFSNGREAQAAAHRYAGKAVSERRRPTSIPTRSKRCLIELLTSTGIQAPASFLVGTAPSKILVRRQATLPLCA